MPPSRTRLAIGLISAAVIALELSLMRALSLRFWHHFAYMTISIALLGFGAAGTALTLLRRRALPRRRTWLCGLCLAFALSCPLAFYAIRLVHLDAQFLAWDPLQFAGVLLLELVLFVPFLFAASAVCLALMGEPGRIGGHYAANLIGSGLGAIAAVAAMFHLSTGQMFLAVAAVGYLAGAVLLRWRRASPAAAGLGVAAAIALAAWLIPAEPPMSPYKTLRQALPPGWPDAKVIYQAEGPLGRIDVVAGSPLRHAPGLSLEWTEDVPPHVLLIVDGDQTSGLYQCRQARDWAFMDYTTGAAAYYVRERPSVLILGAGGGADIGLALYHEAPRITALEMNGQIIHAMTGPLAARGGTVYRAGRVEVLEKEARGYLATTSETFDVIQLPMIDAFGASGAGHYAAQESYLYTVEAMGAMLDRLSDGGLVCVTRWARMPCDGLRIFDTAAEALRRRGIEPTGHLAMIRSWATVTVLVSQRPFTTQDLRALREFCRTRRFDPCHLPDMKAHEANRYHNLPWPYYYEGARALLAANRQQFLKDYMFEIEAPTDDRPYFFHFFRWRAVAELQEQLGRRGRAMLELGYLMVLAAFVQAVLLAALFILLPLVPGFGVAWKTPGKAPAVAYFLLIGLGFMLLEMGLLQKFILYLAHPIYSAAVVIASFLVFAGLGSQVSGHWPGTSRRVVLIAALAVAVIAAAYGLAMDPWLRLTQGGPAWVRFSLAAATIAPLAFAMGHMFPLALRSLGETSPALVPWAWAVNGFASVVAAVGAQLLAMELGLSFLTVLAIACYLPAGLCARRLPAGPRPRAA